MLCNIYLKRKRGKELVGQCLGGPVFDGSVLGSAVFLKVLR